MEKLLQYIECLIVPNSGALPKMCTGPPQTMKGLMAVMTVMAKMTEMSVMPVMASGAMAVMAMMQLLSIAMTEVVPGIMRVWIQCLLDGGDGSDGNDAL